MTDESDPRALLEAARRPRPWAFDGRDIRDADDSILRSDDYADAALIVWAVNHLERLLDGAYACCDCLGPIRGDAACPTCIEILEAKLSEQIDRRIVAEKALAESRAAEARLMERCSELEAALKPIVDSLDLKDERDTDHADAWGHVSAGALRRGRAALSASDGGGGRGKVDE